MIINHIQVSSLEAFAPFEDHLLWPGRKNEISGVDTMASCDRNVEMLKPGDKNGLL